jgi:hypothetical protein
MKAGCANGGDRGFGPSAIAGSYRSGGTKPDLVFEAVIGSEPDVTARMQQILHVMGESELKQSILL